MGSTVASTRGGFRGWRGHLFAVVTQVVGPGPRELGVSGPGGGCCPGCGDCSPSSVSHAVPGGPGLCAGVRGLSPGPGETWRLTPPAPGSPTLKCLLESVLGHQHGNQGLTCGVQMAGGEAWPRGASWVLVLSAGAVPSVRLLFNPRRRLCLYGIIHLSCSI